MGVALLVWIGSSLLAAIVNVQNDSRWTLASEILDVAAAVAILGAFRWAPAPLAPRFGASS